MEVSNERPGNSSKFTDFPDIEKINECQTPEDFQSLLKGVDMSTLEPNQAKQIQDLMKMLELPSGDESDQEQGENSGDDAGDDVADS